MKYTKFLLPLLLVGLTSCYDEYVHDYEEANMGFAIDKPLRTVISERGMSIYVGVAIGGKREVDMNDWAKFVIDETLVDTESGKELLPSDYYTLADGEYFRVRKSNLPVADVRIDFTQAFYDDPLCMEAHYVLPFRMTENSMNAIREGAETSVVAIKYISTYAGTYFRLGEVTEVDASGSVVGETAKYGNAVDLVKCGTATFTTAGPSTVVCPGLGDNSGVGSLTLAMDADANVTVSGVEGKAAVTSATATYKVEGDYEYVAKAGTKAPQFDLQYTYENGGKYYRVIEKLVLRQDPLYDLRVETW